MRITLPILLIGLLVVTTSGAFAASNNDRALPMERGLLDGESWSDIPVRDHGAGLRADTTWYGQYTVIGTDYYALSFINDPDQGNWTFDRDAGPNSGMGNMFEQMFGSPIEDGEGWSHRDMTVNTAEYFRVIDNTLDLGDGVPSPVIDGEYSLWVGADKPQADALCWQCGPGYGNNWCQRVVSPTFAYTGSGDVTLSFLYWVNSEACYDGTQIYLVRADNTELMLNPYPAGTCENNTGWEGGTFTDSIGAWDNEASYTRVVTSGELGGAQDIQFIFEFTADGGWSDLDCQYATIWGPFGADNISVTGSVTVPGSYNFEDGTLQGWDPGTCDPVGDFVDIVDVAFYTILDPCACELEGNILELHAGNAGPDANHPVGQQVRMNSPIIWFGENSLKTIFMQFDMYADLPQENGVLVRPGWYYYPFTCEVTGEVGWSDRVGQDAYNFFGDTPVCGTWRYGGTEIDSGEPVPPSALGVVAILELLGDCDAFGIDPCSGVTNATPLIDNITVARAEGIDAPIVNYDIGTYYQDVGSYPSDLFDPRAVGPANVTDDANMDTEPGTNTDLCGDSLVIAGPIPAPSDPNTRWEAKMWWRVARRAPFQQDEYQGSPTPYGNWKERVAARVPGGADAFDRPDNPLFTWGQMDSVQLGFVVQRNKFLSDYREDDPNFRGENNDDSSPESEMIWDDVLFPGTRIEYFCTANYVHNPNIFYYAPDTSGGFFREFEILPGLMLANVDDCGGTGFDYCAFQPATLYIDAYNRGSQFYVENALRTILNGEELCIDEEGCEIPANRNWDRYDYLDGSSNWNAPFVRGVVPGSNNGMTLNQILGYRAILLNFGTFGEAAAQDEDYGLYTEWLNSPDCDANLRRQYFHVNGDQAGNAVNRPGGNGIEFLGEAFLNNVLGATILCDGFNGNNDDPDCSPPDTSYCLQWLDLDGAGAFDTVTDIDAYGNYCPNLYAFNVFSLNGGSGNRFFRGDDPAGPSKDMFWAQVLNEDLTIGNYRTAIDGVSWHHMTKRDGNAPPSDRCPTDVVNIVDASYSEILESLKWGFSATTVDEIPKLTSAQELADCQGTWNLPTDVGDESLSLRVNRLFQNQPNPFNPRTLIRFSMAQEGPVELAVYDVNGRLVRTLVDGKAAAGLNAVEWDGTDDAGHRVGSGVYWTQMRVGEFMSNKQMVILK